MGHINSRHMSEQRQLLTIAAIDYFIVQAVPGAV